MVSTGSGVGETGEGDAGLLASVRIVEFSTLLGASVTTSLGELGAEVIKIDPPGGDPIARVGPPFAAGTSLLDLHVNRWKNRARLDLSSAENRQHVLELIRSADAVVEVGRPGFLDRMQLDSEVLWAVNPRLVIVRMTGFGASGPYAGVPTHGTAYDAWAGLLPIERDGGGRPGIGHYVPIGIQAGSIVGALALLAGILNARSTGRGRILEVAHADAAAWFNAQAIETALLADRGAPNAKTVADFDGLARHQVYEAADGRLVLLMAPEDKLWRKFCERIERPDLAEHSDRDPALRGELAALFRQRLAAEWMTLAQERALPLMLVNRGEDLVGDPHFVETGRCIAHGDAHPALLAFPIRDSSSHVSDSGAGS